MGEVDHSKNLREKPPLTRVEVKESHQEEAHQEEAHQEEVHQEGVHQGEAHQEEAHQEGVHQGEAHQEEAHQEVVHQEETPIGGTLTLKSIMVTLEEHLEVVLLVMIHLIIPNCSGKEALPLLEFLVSIRRQCLIRQTAQQYEL